MINPTTLKTTYSKRLIISFIIILIMGGVFAYIKYMPNSKISETKSTTSNIAKVGYLEKIDSLYQTITNRVLGDFLEAAKIGTKGAPETKMVESKLQALSQEKQNQLQALFIKSIDEYMTKLDYDFKGFMSVFSSRLATLDQKKMLEEYDIRVQYLGENKYVAEFWEDGLAVNSEANAVSSTNQSATTYPENREALKKSYADIRKSIIDGKQVRYTKVMVLLYTLKDSSFTFLNPFQPMIDLLNQ